jgi:hypothetical protein
MLLRRARPARAEIDETALELLARHGAQILATARRIDVTAAHLDSPALCWARRKHESRCALAPATRGLSRLAQLAVVPRT